MFVFVLVRGRVFKRVVVCLSVIVFAYVRVRCCVFVFVFVCAFV